MEQQLFSFLEEHPGFTRLQELEVRHIKALFFSSLQLMAVASYPNEVEMEQHWERAAHQLAHNIQNRLPLELDDLRWDMYLIIFVNQDKISSELKRLIENNRFYFRKIVLTRSDMSKLSEKLPLRFDLPSGKDNTGNGLLFNDGQFLKELKDRLSEGARNQLGELFFTKGAKSVEDMLSLFSRGQAEGMNHEN
ncbi:ABC-three component system middle component 1 [Paenibacillus sepulcri]|uniref:GGDEF domain-containing protein n=1 Tax=Paenibacillus sepulcri TaxID=359917 RepID=A0ABS7C1U2_9BACL|nr:hypothetical protein [Paenibacillus sepulcri]